MIRVTLLHDSKHEDPTIDIQATFSTNEEGQKLLTWLAGVVETVWPETEETLQQFAENVEAVFKIVDAERPE